MTKKISKYLADLRRGEKISQEELGYRIGMSRSKVSSWEIGRRDISISDAVVICDYYNISIDSLLNPTGMNREKFLDVSKTFARNKILTRKEKLQICKEVQKILLQEITEDELKELMNIPA